MASKDNLSPDQFSYDRNIVGKVTANLPSGEKEHFYTAGAGLTQPSVRHPQDLPGPMYHGTPREITSGQVELGHPSNFVGRPMSHVYMADDLEEARNYARGTGHVYEVRPTGWYGHRRDARGASWASSHPLDIVRKVSPQADREAGA